MNQLFEGWAMVELMGHVRLAGYVTEEEHFGAKLGRIDVPLEQGTVTQFFGGSSVYRVTPCSEVIAKQIAQDSISKPIKEWEVKHVVDPKRLTSLPIEMSPNNFSEEECEDDDDDDFGYDFSDRFDPTIPLGRSVTPPMDEQRVEFDQSQPESVGASNF
ncbi:MAG: hypothetical protein K2W95_15855 [Candidatus Obscuribacterales bacterium]|nr:hypothetical protein [Candidatus Obscuribacterales bacterium]